MNIRSLALTATALLTSAGIAAGASLDVEAAHGAGLASWWAANGKTAVVAAACLIEGYAASALFVSGVTGVGGVVAAAGLVVAALACTTG